jgi:hypothetical protein
VVKDAGRYKMFYSVRNRLKGYRIGYAESQDGVVWDRKDDKVGIDVSQTGWDAGVVFYASVLRARNQTYMFYNGNYENSISQSGKSCLGYATMQNP